MRVSFLGSGRMATALAGGLLARGVSSAEELTASSPDAPSREAFTAATGCAAVATNAEACRGADVILIAVKPALVPAVLGEVAAEVADKLMISIAAGVRLARLEAGAPAARHVRAMPNTPAQIGAGATAYCPGARATPADLTTAATVLGAVGLAVQVTEEQLDAVTGLSGSGPAYVFRMIEALVEGGVSNGLPAALARQLAVRTVLGAARLVEETGEDPATLRDNVTSPNGTTFEGLKVLNARGVPEAFVEAVTAATRRSRELGAAS